MSFKSVHIMTAAFLSLTLLLTACGDGPVLSWKPETAAEKELRVSKERLQRTVGEGGVAGSAAGAAIGALLGGPAGAFRGAELGRFAGAAGGAYVRGLQEQFATEEEVLGQVIRDLQVTNARLEASIAALRTVVAETRAAAAAPDPTRVARNQAEAAGAIEAAERQAAFFGATRQVLVSEVAPVAGTGFDPELERLRRRISTMREIAVGLADAT